MLIIFEMFNVSSVPKRMRDDIDSSLTFLYM